MHWLSIILLAGTIQGALLSLALFTLPRGNRAGNRYLACLLLLFALALAWRAAAHAQHEFAASHLIAVEIATISMLGGLILVFAASPMASLLGLQQTAILIGIGLSLWLYAAGLFLNARRSIINRAEAVIAVALNFGWVAGSALVVAWGVLTTTGNWIVAIVADIVLLFGILQAYGLRKMAAGK